MEVRRMYDAGGELLNDIKSMYVNSLACVRVNGRENECFKIVRQVCIIPLGSLMDAVIKELKMGMGRGEE